MVIIIFTFNKFNISFIGYMDFFLQGIIIFCIIFIITIILNSIIFKEDFNLTKTIIKENYKVENLSFSKSECKQQS